MPMKVPFVDLEAQYRPLRAEILAAMTRVCDRQQFILGPEVVALEEELARLLDVRHALAVSSGTDALLLGLMALDLAPGDEVITTPYSFFATAGAIVRAGARPVFADIDPVTFNIDPERIRATVTTRTKVIVPVHLFGLSADLDPITEFAAERGIAVLEDAAQAIGATCGSRKVGGIGTAGCFSFYPTKNLGAFGDAGLLTTNDDRLARRARLLRVHGMERTYVHQLVGGNFRMDALQAAVLRVKAPHLESWTAARRANAATYATLAREAGLGGWLTLPAETDGFRHTFNQFVIRTPERDTLKRHLEESGIATEVYYPVPFHLQPCFRDLGGRPGDFPEAERAAAETLALPIFPGLTGEQQRLVVDAITAFAASHTMSASGARRHA